MLLLESMSKYDTKNYVDPPKVLQLIHQENYKMKQSLHLAKLINLCRGCILSQLQ